jgi:spore germination cell wall hydrolase CwlJ-like protein
MYNSHRLDTKRLSAAWKMMLAILSITFIWQTITTRTYASVLPNSVPAQEIATQEVAPPPVPSREEVLRQQYASADFLDVVETGEQIQYNKTDLFCLAKNIYHEAGYEPITGRYAVAQVTINRTQNPDFEGSVCEVVFAPYQFSWANNRSRRWTTPTGPGWQEARRIALDVLENGKRVKGMEDALYYHATYVRPSWASRFDRVTRIGLHIFYEV